MSYDIGDRVVVSVVFYSDATLTTAADPTAVTLEYMAPNGTITTLTYGVDGALVKDSTGNYHVNLDPTQSGVWKYKWQGTGAIVSASPDTEFTVTTSVFA
jgi:hypothetical protein